MWELTIVLALGLLGIRVLTSRAWWGARHADLRGMSPKWLKEQRTLGGDRT